MAKIIDPPSGWRYGFPKEIPENITDVRAWLVKNGYPQSEIDACGEHFYCRYLYNKESKSDGSKS